MATKNCKASNNCNVSGGVGAAASNGVRAMTSSHKINRQQRVGAAANHCIASMGYIATLGDVFHEGRARRRLAGCFAGGGQRGSRCVFHIRVGGVWRCW